MTSMQSSSHNSIATGSMRRQGFSRYCRKSCCLGRCSCGCVRSTGNRVTQPKMMEQTVQCMKVCCSSSSRGTHAQRGPAATAAASDTAAAQPVASGRPRAVGAGALGAGAPEATAMAAASSDSGLAKSERSQRVTFDWVSCACIMPTSAVTSLTATMAAPGRTVCTALAAGPPASGADCAGSGASAVFSRTVSPSASSRSCSGDGPAARLFHWSNREPGRTASTIRHSNPSLLGR
mmetsp:Transcript_38263/g.114289  ORF Transcript_38263/g.114289 Transcript_38263/m.114289 type:complete len:235 (-) Transcript_38263:598-1302(-)